MPVEVEPVESSIPYTCRKCKTKMLLPSWVSTEAEMERAVFQCATCGREAEVDIREYPKLRVRIVVSCPAATTPATNSA